MKSALPALALATSTMGHESSTSPPAEPLSSLVVTRRAVPPSVEPSVTPKQQRRPRETLSQPAPRLPHLPTRRSRPRGGRVVAVRRRCLEPTPGLSDPGAHSWPSVNRQTGIADDDNMVRECSRPHVKQRPPANESTLPGDRRC